MADLVSLLVLAILQRAAGQLGCGSLFVNATSDLVVTRSINRSYFPAVNHAHSLGVHHRYPLARMGRGSSMSHTANNYPLWSHIWWILTCTAFLRRPACAGVSTVSRILSRSHATDGSSACPPACASSALGHVYPRVLLNCGNPRKSAAAFELGRLRHLQVSSRCHVTLCNKRSLFSTSDRGYTGGVTTLLKRQIPATRYETYPAVIFSSSPASQRKIHWRYLLSRAAFFRSNLWMNVLRCGASPSRTNHMPARRQRLHRHASDSHYPQQLSAVGSDRPSQHQKWRDASRYGGLRWHFLQQTQQPPCASHNGCSARLLCTHGGPSSSSYSFSSSSSSNLRRVSHPFVDLIACSSTASGAECHQQPPPFARTGERRVGSSATMRVQASCTSFPVDEGRRHNMKKAAPGNTQLKPLSFDEFNRANSWVEKLISEHLVSMQSRAPVNAPPREGPSSEWEMLAEGRLLKRQVAGGEGDVLPTLRSNVTIEFSLYTLGGNKITDNRAFNTTMMEFPVSNAMPGMQVAVKSMRKLERSIFLLAPELILPPDFEVTLAYNETENTHLAWRETAKNPKNTSMLQQQQQASSTQTPVGITLGGGDWLGFDITMCNIYDKDARWWRMGPDLQFIRELPEEHIPSNVTHDEWLEQKADAMRTKIEGEMLTNPNSHYWEDIEPAMNPAQKQKIDSFTTSLYGLDKPSDPRQDGSRGFRDHTLYRSGGVRHGYDMGDRMSGASKHYVWRETLFSFEIVLFIKEGIRSDHVTWHIDSKRLDVFFGGKQVFGDEFVHSIAYKDGAEWTLTDAACRFPAMDLKQLQAIYDAVPLTVPTIPSFVVATGTDVNSTLESTLSSRAREHRQLPRSYAHPELLSLAPEETEGLKLPLDRPGLHILLQKGRLWTQMWGSPFKYI